MRIIDCLTQDHDLRLVAIAALVCALGSFVTVRLFRRTRCSLGPVRLAWSCLGALTGGSTVWCTHFVAMLAYQPGPAVTYEPALTALSYVIAVAGGGLAFAVGARRQRGAPEIGGALFGFGIGAMHYAGMAAFAVDAVVTWSAAYVASSLLAAVSIAALAFNRAATSRRDNPLAIVLLALAIVALHFTGMAALTIQPFAPLEDAVTGDDARAALASAIAGVGLLIVGASAVAQALDRAMRDRAAIRLRRLADSSVDGIVVERDGCIIELNTAFADLLGARREALIGHSFKEFLAGAADVEDGKLVLANLNGVDGAEMPVEIVANYERQRRGCELVIYAVRDRRPRLAQERRMLHLARHDALTELPNRASFMENLAAAMARGPNRSRFALLAFDLDRFKDINDFHGHAAGDHVLRVVAQRLREGMPVGAEAARFGGDEFVARAPVGDKDAALDLAGRLQRALAADVYYQGSDLRCGASVGVAMYPEDGATPTVLLNNADLAMYRAKSAANLSVAPYEAALGEEVRARLRLAQELRDALARGQFELRYQAQVSLRDGSALGYEALLAWRHPRRGYVSPEEFVPIAEETGLIAPIGDWVLRAACRSAATWSAPYRLAVNISAVQLALGDLPRSVAAALAGSGLPPERLELEVTETAMIRDPAKARAVLQQLQAIGVSIAVDDFGSGYSSLATLKELRFDKIKLDRSFGALLEHDSQTRAILEAVVTLGRGLWIPVMVKGVESVEQLRVLQRYGCQEAQGYLFGRPEPTICPPSLSLTAILIAS